MSMQEFELEAQPASEHRDYQAGYVRSHEMDQQKLQPPKEQRNVLPIVVLVLSLIGFILTVAGMIASALVLRLTLNTASLGDDARTLLLVGGAFVLICAFVVMLIFLTLFVVAVVTLARRSARRRRYESAALHIR